MSHTKDVLIKLQESGPEALTHDELLFCHIIEIHQVCKQCGNDIHATTTDGIRICPVCQSKEFESIEIDLRELKCSYCNKKAYPGFYQTWTQIPFVNIERKSFYCGCRGCD